MNTSTSSNSALVDKSEDLEALFKGATGPLPYPGMQPKELIKYRKSDQGKALAAWVREKFKKAKELRSKEERQWNLNLAFYNGNQWVERFTAHDPNYGRLGIPRGGSNRTRHTINRVKPICRTEMAKFISQKPGASVVPATDEDEDLLAATAGEQVWYSTAERGKLDVQIQLAVFWEVITGNGFIKTIWDHSKIDQDNPDTAGDVEFRSISPYQMFVSDINEKELQRQPFLIQAYAENTERLALKYTKVLEGVTLKPTCRETSIQEETYASPRSAQKTDGTEVFDSNVLYEAWIRPGETKLMPNGGCVILIDETIVELHNEGMPYNHNMFPYTHLPHIDSDRFWRTSIIEEIIDLQRDYNLLRSQISETRKKMGKAQILSPKGAVTASKWTSEIGQIIEYKLGMQPPVPMPLQNMPTYIMQEVEFILRDFEDISGQHEVSKGQTPPGVTAATAIAYLQEADDSYLLPSFKNLEAAYGSIAKQTLLLFTQFWDAPRLVKVVGKDDAFSTLLLGAADIAKATDIRIEPGSALPQSKAARQAFIMDLMTNGFVPVPEGLDMLEIGGKQKLMDIIKNDIRQAQRENIKFKRLTEEDIQQYAEQVQQLEALWEEQGTGEPMPPPPLIIPVNDYDEHEVHIQEHDRFRRTQEFEVLPQPIKTLMQSHVEQHKMAMQAKMLEQALSQIPTDGTVEGVSGVQDEQQGPAEVDFNQEVEEPLPNAAPGTPQDVGGI